MASTRTATGSYTFGEYRLDLDRGALTRAGVEVELRPKSYAVLCYLVEHRGRLVTTDELLDAVWGPAIVTKGTLTQSLIDIRRALGEPAQAMLRTVHGRGYLFDVPDGENQHEDESHSLHAGLLPASTARRVGLALGAAFVSMAVWWAASHNEPDPSQPAGRGTAVPSIAVLPFVDMSPGGDQAYLGEGFAEEILNALAQSGGLRVIARTSSFSFRDRPAAIQAIAERLGVTHVLEGSVRKSGDRVRVIARLVDARDRAYVWSKDFDREITDIFSVQDEIAASIAGALNVPSAKERRGTAARHDLAAYEHFLRGRFLFHRRGPGDVERAREHFQEATGIEPEYAAAWAALAGTWQVQLADVDRRAEQPTFVSALEAAARALELDPRNVEAHLRTAVLEYMRGDVAAAWRHVGIAEELEPENMLLLGLKGGIALGDGDLARAIEFQRRAVARDPLSPLYRSNLVETLLSAGRLEEGRAQAMSVSELGGADLHLAMALVVERRYAEAAEFLPGLPDSGQLDVALALTGWALGRAEQAQAAIGRLEARDTTVSALRLAEVYAHSGDVDAAWRWLDESRRRLAEESPFAVRRWRALAWGSVYLGSLRDDARWSLLFGGTTAEAG